MQKDYKKWLKGVALALLLGVSPQLMAQAVIFPQEKQPGVALAENTGEVFTIKNDLLSATFRKHNGKLTFEGCEAMGLKPNDELFRIQLGNGSTTVSSTQMTLGDVTIETLDADPSAATGSFRFPGKAIVAHYVYSDAKGKALTIVWRAILRDGSHYLRTKMDIKADRDVKMFSMIPARYEVNNEGNQKVPAVVGNTRGAVVMNDKIFAGLESPMGINTVESDGADLDLADFTPKSWNANSFKWHPGSQVPAELLKNGLTAENIVGARGYLKFYKEGKNTIIFTYTGGSHRLNIVGVDAVDMKGNVVAKDYHLGYAGSQHSRNGYVLNIPSVDYYMVRYFVETKTESITSQGKIAYNNKIAPAEVVFDGKENTAEQPAQKLGRALSANEIGENDEISDAWKPAEWVDFTGTMPQAIYDKGWAANNLQIMDRDITINAKGELNVDFQYGTGSNGLTIAGVFLLSADGKEEIVADSHKGFSGNEKRGNVYKLNVPYAGKFKMRYYVEKSNNNSTGDIRISLLVKKIIHLPAPKTSVIQCKWSRDVVLKKDSTWYVSGVIGLLAPDQARRSIASYVERERAVPWRAYPIYNSWYELNINRNNDPNYSGNMHDYQCVEVVKEWQKNLYEPYGTGIKAFVWDDGWDIYGTWKFNQNFKNGFDEPDRLARQMDAGTGVWLGPVGGYGQSGNYRRAYWNQAGRGGMRLSNPKYYDVFYEGCTDLMLRRGYDFRFFKFDGISAQFTALGPDPGTEGEENAEGIIYAELDMRKVNPYIFFNTSVGTWASPFWFRITDAVWRHENDYGEIGNNNNSRERWITYRDRLVYQNFVQNSPMCPINCLMTHGFILSDYGPVSKDRNYDAIVREMRCAFACGSAMVELYCDFKLMNTIKDNNGKEGALWGELSKCIEWQKKNEEVLPDIHWVGGNPWDGSAHHVYGWGAWNGKDAVLALRNGANNAQTFETTLREALEIPAYVKGTLTLKKGFDDQKALEGLAEGQPIDIDAKLTLKLPASSVYVFDNTVAKPVENYIVNELKQVNNRTAYTVKSVDKGYLLFDPADQHYVHSSYTADNRVDATPAGTLNEQFAFVRTDAVPEGQYFMYAMGAKKFVTSEGGKMALSVEPMETVTLVPMEGADHTQFMVKFPGNKSINLTDNGDYYGTKLMESAANNGNLMTVTAVNHKAGLSSARARVEDLYKYTKLSREGWSIEASSADAEANKMLDDNINSYWTTQAGDKMAHTLTFNLGTPQKFCSFGYYARLDSEAGVCKSFALDISDDNETWKTVKSGELQFNDRKFLWGDLGKTVSAQYVRLTIASNQQGTDEASIAEFYLGYDGSAVSPEMNSLPLFTTEENPTWYPVYFKRGGAYLADQGADQKLLTANKAEVDAQKWQFIGNEFSFIMKSKMGNYLYLNGDRYFTTKDKAKASVMEFVQNGTYLLEMKVKGAGNCMNQVGGGGAGRELGNWNQGDGGNVLQVMPVTIPAAKLPIFSNDKNIAWYVLQFKNGKNVIEDKGEGNSVRLAAKNDGSAQLWKFVGEKSNFQIVSNSGRYMVVSDEAEEEVGPQAGANAHPVRALATPYEPGFRMIESTNDAYAPAWEIASNDPAYNGKCFNQHAGTQEGRVIGFWNLGDNNNPLEFIQILSTGIEDAVVEPVAVEAIYTLSGVRVSNDLHQLPKGIYIVNGKKMIVK